jgi:hypothetical protein
MQTFRDICKRFSRTIRWILPGEISGREDQGRKSLTRMRLGQMNIPFQVAASVVEDAPFIVSLQK